MDLIEGIVYCDYTIDDFSCKPEAEFYQLVGYVSQVLHESVPNRELRQ